MATGFVLIDAATKKALAVASTAWGKVLCVQSPGKEFGTFNSTTLGALDTFVLAETMGDGGIELTDLLLTTEKKAAAVITVRFYDGTNAVNVLTAYPQDLPISIALNFAGNWAGWQNAHVEVVVTGAAALGSCAIGYIKRLKGDTLKYTDWIARR